MNVAVAVSTTGPRARRRLGLVSEPSSERSASVLVEDALRGDRRAWEEIVARYRRVAWKVITSFDLADPDREDVFSATFFRLFERLGTIREPEKLPGWIATTARNETLTLLRSRGRERPTDLAGHDAGVAADHDERLLDTELRVALRRAFSAMDPECRSLLLLLTADPPLSYDEVAELSGRPRGSIGPTRQRCLDRLRRSAELRPFLDGSPA